MWPQLLLGKKERFSFFPFLLKKDVLFSWFLLLFICLQSTYLLAQI